MAERWFLKLDGIVGDSTDAAHRDEIEVQSFSWGVANAGGSGGGGGGGAGRPTFQDLVITARISVASPPLFLACATGRHLRTAVLTGVRGGGQGPPRDALRYDLADVLVTSVQHGDSAGGPPTESVSFSYSRIVVTVTPQSPTGATATPVTAGYDTKAGKQI